MAKPNEEWNRKTLDPVGRELFVRKVKADRLAWIAAELLSVGKHAEANSAAQQGIALIGHDGFIDLCKRYATASFRMPQAKASEFLMAIETPAA